MKYFIYWQNKKTPYYISKCISNIQSILKDNLIILNEKNIKTYIPHFPNYFSRIPKIALQVDYIRIAILYYHGGCYLDADTILFPNFTDITLNLPNKELIGVGKNNIITGNALLIAPIPKSNTLLQIMKKQEQIIIQKKGMLFWSDIGGNLLKVMSPKLNTATFNKNPLAFFGWKNSHIFHSTDEQLILDYLTKIIKGKYKGVVLYNNVMKNHFSSNIPPRCLLWYIIEYPNNL